MKRNVGGERWNRSRVKGFVLLLLVALAFLVPASALDPGWPRQITKPAGKLVLNQPQIDDRKDYQVLDGRMAFTITPTGGDGVRWGGGGFQR
jgi:hypothetical protein